MPTPVHVAAWSLSVLLASLWGVPAGGPDRPFPLTTPADTQADPASATLDSERVRRWDFEHLALDLNIPDLDEPRFSGQAILTARALEPDVQEIVLDARQTMDIQQVWLDGQRAEFVHERNTLTVRLPAPARCGQSVTLDVGYAATSPSRDGCGLNWFVTRPGHEDEGALIFSQGQPDANSYWFPCWDRPDDRLSTELTVTAPGEYQVISNGGLVHSEPDGAGHRTWHWRQEKPHAPYLVSLVVGKFVMAELARAESPVPMNVYAPLDTDPERLRAVFGVTREMLAFYEGVFGTPYPWARYDQVVARHFRFGGMENTGVATLAPYSLDIGSGPGGPESSEGLLAHELAHQWAGNLVTCRTWDHLWLNEGFATYAEALWTEHRRGSSAYLTRIWQLAQRVIRRDTGRLPEDPGLITPLRGDPEQVFSRGANPYSKGAMVLHMLRQRLGEERFFAGLHAYIREHALGAVQTEDLRRAMERAGGEDLGAFFAQWCDRPGIPRVRLACSWDQDARTLSVRLEQTQFIDALNPPFALEIPLEIVMGCEVQQEIIRTDASVHEARFVLPARPEMVTPDPRMRVLCELTQSGPEDWLIAQLRAGPTITAQLHAAAALGDVDSDAAREALGEISRDEGVPLILRRQAQRSLSREE